MKSALQRTVVGIVLATGLPAAGFCAAEAPKALPVLLIKGEVVSIDVTDPAASLLKVKDRYGFETPIYVTPEAKITQADAAAQIASLTPGVTVDVEYNFDVNTAKRHAVSVKIATPMATATSATPAAAPAPSAAMAPSKESAPATMAMPATTATAPAAPADTSAPTQQ